MNHPEATSIFSYLLLLPLSELNLWLLGILRKKNPTNVIWRYHNKFLASFYGGCKVREEGVKVYKFSKGSLK